MRVCVCGGVGGGSEPSRAPGRLRVRSVSASEVEVTWKPLAWSNSRRRILGYEVSLTPSTTTHIRGCYELASSPFLLQSDRNVVLLMVNINVTCCINYSYYCGFSCSTGARGRSQTLPVSSGRWGIKLQFSSGTLRAGAPITCPCGPTTALEWVRRVTQSMLQPKNHVSVSIAFHAANVSAILVGSRAKKNNSFALI